MQSSRGDQPFRSQGSNRGYRGQYQNTGSRGAFRSRGIWAITTRLNVWKLGYTPIKIQNLKPLLQNYSNKAIGTELLQGFQFGFRIGYKGPRLGGESKNLKSVLQFPEAAREKINSEVSFIGRIAGPFSNKPISNL